MLIISSKLVNKLVHPKFKIEYEKINNKRWIKSDHEAYKIQGYINED